VRPLISITVLVENEADAPLQGEHGLSLWIEAGNRRLLFDTGQGSALEPNARALGVDLGTADAIVLSHGHYDHSGGLAQALEQAPHARVYLHPAARAPRFNQRHDPPRAIGMPAPVRRALQRRRDAVVWLREPATVLPGVFATGPIPRPHAREAAAGHLTLDRAGLQPDPVADDMALWMNGASGAIVLLGCAHAGVINTLDAVRTQSGGRPLAAVVGGLHLNAADEPRLAWTVDRLRRLEIGAIHAGHCTGARATECLMAALGDRCRPCRTGTQLTFAAA
jgi:7,8-dihydropterin-6-yl-methyl-4-(beta-D-ribofuranosyl)aminobenzene 5'-phosphate synthase